MIFRKYDTEQATVNEWSRQLTASTKTIFRRYETPEGTLYNWANLLNQMNTGYTFQTYETAERTILDWERKLNMIFNHDYIIEGGNEINGN